MKFKVRTYPRTPNFGVLDLPPQFDPYYVKGIDLRGVAPIEQRQPKMDAADQEWVDHLEELQEHHADRSRQILTSIDQEADGSWPGHHALAAEALAHATLAGHYLLLASSARDEAALRGKAA